MIIRTCLPLLVCWLLCFPICRLSAQVAGKAAAAPDAKVELPLIAGSVNSADLFQTLASDLHWVTGSIAGFSRAFGLETSDERMEKSQVDDLVRRFPASFSYKLDPNGQPTHLQVDVDAFATGLADKKSKLRNFLAKAQGTPISSMSKVEATWNGVKLSPERIVVTMAGLHGFESSAEAVALELYKHTNVPMMVFKYPNDAPILESANSLRKHLDKLHRQYPRAAIVLVTHSMGGLVSRAVLEMDMNSNEPVRAAPASNFGVEHLIQVCPPNHGSTIAQYGPLLEGLEQMLRLVNRGVNKENRILLGMITDGFNEAPADLIPGSKFLTALNAHSRNPAVKYSILAGDDGPLRGRMTGLLGGIWQSISSSVDEPKFVDAKITELLQCDDLRKGKGDGVVAISSARLDGVKDVEVFSMHHLTWSQLDTTAGKEMLFRIAQRLSISL